MRNVTGDEAVFARNHRAYLDDAVDTAYLDPRTLVTFRSGQEWKSAQMLLEKQGDLPIYFAVVGGDPKVLYKAWLRRVLLHPNLTDVHTQRLLKLVPGRTVDEGLWEGKVKTLYAISGCQRIDESSIPITSLVKLSNGEPISADFKYSYSLVRRTPETPSRAFIASDIWEPPSRTEVRVNRVIRDTVLVQRLKALHDDRCQRCFLRLDLPDGSAYSEGHHLQPLGSPHHGPDVPENVLILCPNCHALLDLAVVSIEKSSLRLHPAHAVGQQFLSYHNVLVSRAACRPTPGLNRTAPLRGTAG